MVKNESKILSFELKDFLFIYFIGHVQSDNLFGLKTLSKDPYFARNTYRSSYEYRLRDFLNQIIWIVSIWMYQTYIMKAITGHYS